MSVASSATASRELDRRLESLFASDPAAMSQAPEIWRELADAGPVYEFGPSLLVTTYTEAKRLIRDASSFSNTSFTRGSRRDYIRSLLSDEGKRAFDVVSDFEGLMVSRRDGEDHARLRKIAHSAFTPRRIAVLSSEIEAFVDASLDDYAGSRDPVDLMPFAYRIPLMVIGSLLGVPDEDTELIRAWSDRIGQNRGGSDVDALLDAEIALGEFRAYVSEVIEDHRRHKAGSDLVMAMLEAAEAGQMDAAEMAAMFVLLLNAGHDTTMNLLSIGLWELLGQRGQWAHLTSGVTTATQAVEEMLRYVTPVQWVGRVAVDETTLDGHRVLPGTTVLVIIAAANRDPEVFDDPDSLELTRPNSGSHLGFGFGPHFCLGAALTRIEGEIVFRRIADRFPDSRRDGEVNWCGNAMMRRLDAVPVTLR